MGPLQAVRLDVEGRRRHALGDAEHVAGGHEQKLRLWIDEPADKPRARDTIHLGPGPGDPERATGGVARRQRCGVDCWLPRGDPGGHPAFEYFRLRAGLAQPGSRALTGSAAVAADEQDGRSVPTRQIGETTANRPRDQLRQNVEFRGSTQIEHGRRARRADETGELFSRYGMGGRHDASSGDWGHDTSA